MRRADDGQHGESRTRILRFRKAARILLRLVLVAAMQGLEPRLLGSEPSVLPIERHRNMGSPAGVEPAESDLEDRRNLRSAMARW